MNKHILVIDDDNDLLQLLKLKLNREGFSVQTLLNGEDFLDSITDHRPDLVLMDINMPYISGNALCKVLKNNKSTADIPIVMLSGNENIARISGTCGADAFLPKPCDADKLTNTIRKYLD